MNAVFECFFLFWFIFGFFFFFFFFFFIFCFFFFLFTFFFIFNCWFALLPVHMLLQMQLIHEISTLKNLVKNAEVYNQDLEVSIYVGIPADKELKLLNIHHM